mmetsp:Transcript_71838/g.150087  ORF Transcript_71838/g.150087 Transcript_71838/m.150087 type:complete len:83 (-) Transcript_71838:2275-2523(-)
MASQGAVDSSEKRPQDWGSRRQGLRRHDGRRIQVPLIRIGTLEQLKARLRVHAPAPLRRTAVVVEAKLQVQLVERMHSVRAR